jgi:organic radical activating enzyme
MKLKVSELFYSAQGEGRYVGLEMMEPLAKC